jgi:hypothetical protein
MRGALKHIEHVQNWLALATAKLEEHLDPRPFSAKTGLITVIKQAFARLLSNALWDQLPPRAAFRSCGRYP